MVRKTTNAPVMPVAEEPKTVETPVAVKAQVVRQGAAKGKAKVVAPPAPARKVRRPRLNPADNVAIKVATPAAEFKGLKGEVWNLVKRCKTVGEYKKLRAKNDLEGLGGYFGAFVQDGNITLPK
jgi:hypothetical protein